MKFAQKYTIVQLLENVPEGVEYDWRDWPLHVTMADIFAIDWDVATMMAKMSELLADQPQFTSVAKGGFCLGDKGMPVMLLEPRKELKQLHFDVINMLEPGNVRLNTPQYIKEGWLPHSTIQRYAGLKPGDIVTFKALTLIDMFPNQNGYRRKIIKTIPFAGG